MISSSLSRIFKATGNVVTSFGKYVEGLPAKDIVLPQTRIVKYGKNIPSINGAFVASSASVIGKVTIESNASVWYGAVVRGDINTIKIGEGSVIGDKAIIHVSGTVTHFPTTIGKNAYVGSGAIIHGSTLEDNSFVGEKAQVLDGAVVKSYAKVSAGSLVTKGTTVPSGQLWSGVPAVYVRDLSAQEKSDIDEVIKLNIALATEHILEMNKTLDEIDEDELGWWNEVYRSPDTPKYDDKVKNSNIIGEVSFHRFPGQLLDSKISASYKPADKLPLNVDEKF